MKSVAYEFEIQGVKVGRESRPYILAEIGINHEGNVELAESMIFAAKESGADGVKFQTFKAESLAHPEKAPEYYKLFKSVELNRSAHEHLQKVAKDAGIAFISTPFGIPEATMLAEMGVPAIKIASGDATNHRLLKHVAGLRLPVILSTGMCELSEVRAAREVLLNAGCAKLAILHCVSRYPTTPDELNLRAIGTLINVFPEVIGFSDHTEGVWAAPAAVSIGARFIEKHFTLDRKLPGPDHALSVEPHEMRQLVDSVQNVFNGLGSGEKIPCPEETSKRHLGRKGIYAARKIDAGKFLTEDDVKLSRPQGEIGADEYFNVIGKKIFTAINEGEEITRDNVAWAGSPCHEKT